MAKIKYSFKIGGLKSVKNVAIIWGIPALLLLLDNYTQWVPDQYNQVLVPIVGLLSYLVKNWISNRNK